MGQPVRLHLLPLAVAAILSLTAVPADVGMGTLRIAWLPDSDFFANVLLFLPLGAALSRHRLLTAGLMAFALSCTIELSQYWSIDRFTSPFDVLANTIGGVVGAPLWNRLRRSRDEAAEVVKLGVVSQAALALLCSAIAFAWSRPGISSAVAGWDPTYALLLGNERTGDRSWAGVIEGLALVPEAMGRTEASQLSVTAPSRWGALIPRTTLLDTHRYALEPNAALHLSEETARDFAARAAEANAFTVVARVTPASLQQTGPARILSFSRDPYHRNVDLGQEQDGVVFRVRTTISGDNGERFRAQSEGVLQDRAMTLVASYDGAVSRVYVDGRLAARSNLAAAGCRVRALCDGGAHLAWSLIGGTAAVLAIALLRALAPLASWCVGLGSGALLSTLAVALAGDARIVPAPWTALLPLAGAVAVVLAIRLAAKTVAVAR